MSSQFRNLHQYVCQRIVSLFETLAKRHSRLQESLQASGSLIDGTETDISDIVSYCFFISKDQSHCSIIIIVIFVPFLASMNF